MSGAQTTPPETRGFANLLFSGARTVGVNRRRSLMAALIRVIECRRLGLAGTAEALGLSEPRVRELLRGNVEAFSADELVRMLGVMGIHV